MFPLRYVPFETVVDTAFWHGLADRKLNKYCLSEGPFPISAQYCNNLAPGLSPRVSVDVTSFDDFSIRRNRGSNTFILYGHLLCYNSIDAFKDVDKQLLINQFGSEMINKALVNKEFLKNPDCVYKFILITYCDLKKHKFYFWFGYPAILHSFQPNILCLRRLDEELNMAEINQFLVAYDNWRKEHTSSFFIVETGLSITVHSFSNFLKHSMVYVGFCDSSTDVQYPSCLLRNIVYLLCTQISEKTLVKFICFRDRYVSGLRDCSHSLVLQLELEPVESSFYTKFAGWEKWKNQVRPRMIDLSSSLDPIKLSESAVDLNLKLMKWRLMPDLKLCTFRNTKCLLIGSGTLGCNVARLLLSWGVNTITLVDNNTVSPSNPVRQSLFVFNDAIGVGKPKAVVAAEALLAIYPGVHARGVELSIPMPGHQVTSEVSLNDNGPNFVELCKKTCDELSNLIQFHDVIFLLTDTRESRWLPTLLANVYGKFVINAALGFDTFLVMRHGLNSAGLSPSFVDIDDLSGSFQSLATNVTKKECNYGMNSPKMVKFISGSKLGCYFCNDVVGPMNSMRNRSLDQQCTVTRPGISMIAAALAVELMISVLQHPLGFHAAADIGEDFEKDQNTPSLLGLVPHQIRGFLSHYTQILPATIAFSKCSACSQSVLNAYKSMGFDFLLNVFNDSFYLERICGLDELHSEIKDDVIMMLSDSE